MRSRLAQSLGYIFDRIGPDLGVRNEDSVRAVEAIRARRQSPQLFGAYYDLVLAVERDEIDEARGFAGEIVERLDTPPPAAWVASIASRPASDEDRYQRLLLPEEISAFEPRPEDFTAARERIARSRLRPRSPLGSNPALERS